MSDRDQYDYDLRDRPRGDRDDRHDRDRGREQGLFGREPDRGDRGRRDRDDRFEDRSIIRRDDGGRSSRRDERGYSEERDRHYGSDDFNGGLAMDETRRLIASNKVEGTAVYGRDGKKLGTIHNFMVDKCSGQVEYAVLRHGGGFLGLSESYCPLPWDMLTYDNREEGYRVDLTEYELENRTNYDRDSRPQRRR